MSGVCTTEAVLSALAFAADRHRRQRRKDADLTPYINHVIAVTTILAVEGGVTDGTLLVAAALHDTVEDTGTTFDELLGRFGRDVRDLVAEVTDDKSLPKAVRKQLQIVHAPASSLGAKQLKVADKIANLRDLILAPPAGWPLARRLEYFDWAERVVAGCRGANGRLEGAFDLTLGEARRRAG